MIAKIYYNNCTQKEYSGEGTYVLVNEDDYAIADHICSNRGWAEIDLTNRIENILNLYNITEVYSNGRLV